LLHAQKITGTWEGEMKGEFIQINVEQRGNELCGYTYDYELDKKASHCVATFEGGYDPEKELWYISGKKFIENSGSHVRMRIILWFESEDVRNVLRGKVFTSASGSYFFEEGTDIKVKRVSSKPQKMGNIIPPCFPEPVKPAIKQPVTVKPATTVKTLPKPPPPKTNLPKTVPAKPIPAKPVPAKPVPVKPVPVKPVPPVTVKPSVPKQVPVKADTIKKATAPIKLPVIVQADKEITKRMNARKQTEQNRLVVNVKKINLKVYDNGIVDDDTVSIFYNGKLLLSHQRLSETAIEFNLELDENVALHEIIMYAENLGGIPPNTALIVVTAGDKRYELRSKASLVENAVLVFEYKPPM
ncbi:MAG TPA: hypothetical protein VLR49_03635, partial [Ferruginibacter sp.]|nr:hypothetical protein [Ferruginibacter sp.]